MLRPVSLLPALTAIVATSLTLGSSAAHAETSAANPAHAATAAHPRLADPDEPLTVRLTSLPAQVPRKGKVRISGTVTNESADTWDRINIYQWRSYRPLTSAAELAEKSTKEDAEIAASRILDIGRFETVDSLAPGASASFTVAVPIRELGFVEPGVYWIGIHALGEGPDGRDTDADGRARTFIPLVRPGVGGAKRSLPAALVVPLRQPTRRNDTGALTRETMWKELFARRGRLNNLIDLEADSGAIPLNWLVDPAVLLAAQSIGAGNPERNLGRTVEEEGITPENSPSTSGEPTEDPSDEPTPEATAEPETPESRAAAAWLDSALDTLDAGEAWALPFADLDVAAAAIHDPAVYQRALGRSAEVLDDLGVAASPVVAAPSGYLNEAALALVDAESLVLLGDQVLTPEPTDLPDDAGPLASRVTSQGHTVLLSSSGVRVGGPGPEDPDSPIALRQRILSEAALRLLAGDNQPLIASLPTQWDPADAGDFFVGLDTDWLDFEPLSDLRKGPTTPMVAGSFAYPDSQFARQVPASTFQAVDALIEAGASLEEILTFNDTVAGAVADQAIGHASYFARNTPRASLAGAEDARLHIQGQLSSIEVTAPRGVILSSDEGSFAPTVTNGLDEPVTVRLIAQSDSDLRLQPSEAIRLAPGTTTRVRMTAHATRLGVHDVELLVTDLDGAPLGSSDSFQVRTAQVSAIIWVIMGGGATLLFGAIAFRIYRRVRGAR